MLSSVQSRRLLTVLVFSFLFAFTPTAHAITALGFKGLSQTLNTGGSTALSSPSGIVVDAAGDVYIADTGNGRIVEVNAQGAASVLTITGLSPALSSPQGIAIDGTGNLYIADTGNSRVVEVTSAGVGSAINMGSVTLLSPQGLALDQAGDIFIADTGNSRIVKVPSGGAAAALSITVSSGPSALSSPIGMAVNVSGQLYIADSGSGHNRIVTVAAGSTTGVVLSIAGEITLGTISGITVDGMGNVFIADTSNNRIAEIDTAGNGSVLLSFSSLSLDGPAGVAVDVFGTVYVADTLANQALVVSPAINTQITSGIAGYSLNKSAVGFGHVPLGSATAVSLSLPFSIGGTAIGAVKVFTSGKQNLDFTISTDGCTGMSVTSCSEVIQFLPTAPGLRSGAIVLYDSATPQNPILTVPLYGWADSPVAALAPNTATLISTGGVIIQYPFQLALDGGGNMYVGNYVQINSNPKVVKIAAGGGSASVVSTSGVTLGTSVTGIALDGAGNLFIADYYQDRIVVVTPGGVASVLSINGLSPALGEPTELAFDAAGNLYIADYSATARTYARIVKVSTLTVSGSISSGLGEVINTGSYTFLNGSLTGVAVAPNGTIYIAARTANSSHIVQVTAAGVASELTPTGFTFSDPQGAFVDGMGNLYVEDSGNSRVVRITTAGVASALSVTGLTNPSTLAAGFGVTVDALGNLYIPDWTNNRIVFVNISGAALTFTSTKQGFTSTDSPKTATVSNLGDQALVFSTNPSYTANFINNGADTNPCTSSTSLLAGTICDVSVEFTPQSVGSLSAGITVTNDTLNVAASTQQVSVSGIGLNPGDTTSTTVTIVPASVADGQTATITATVSDTTAGHTSTIPTGPVTFTDTVGSTITTLHGGASINLSAGQAVLTGVLLSGIGTHSITATYAGVTGSYLTSSSSTTAALSKASVTVTGPATQPVGVTTGQAGSATVTVTGAYTTIAAPSGTISYSILNASSTSVGSGTATLTAGSASSTATVPTPSSLAAGSYTISVTYSGDSNYLASSAATTIQLRIGQLTPIISWSPATTSTFYGATLVGFLNASAAIGSTAVPGVFTYTATLSGGSAVLVTSANILGAGSYTLTATFTPTDTATYQSVSKTTTITVSEAAPTINWNPAAAAITYGAALTGILNASAVTGSTAVPGVFTYTATLSGGSAVSVSSVSELRAGSYLLTAAFTPASTANYSSVSKTTTFTVTQATPTIALTSSVNPVLTSNPTILSAMVSSPAGTPTGTVTFLDGTTPIGQGTLSAGVATLSIASLTVGTHTITVTSSGDTNFVAATSNGLTQLVLDFSLGTSGSGSGSTPTQTVTPGGAATYPLAIVPTNGTILPTLLTLTVSGMPPGATAVLAPSSWTQLTGTSWSYPANVALVATSLTIQLPSSAASLDRKHPSGGKLPPLWWGVLLLPFAGKLRRRGRRLRRTASVLLLLAAGGAAMAGLSGCSSATGLFSHQQQTYTVTVTATSGTLSHSTAVALTVE